jgi:glycosyltransferase involved in cell wall biosynthesis
MRILHVVTRLGLGGAERVAETLACASVAHGHQVAFAPIVASHDRAYGDNMAKNLRASGVEVFGSATSTNPKVAALEGAGRLASVVERMRPDVVHLHTEIPEFAWALAGLRARRVRGVPVVRTIHNTVLWGGWGRLGRFAERRLAGARVATVSLAARQAFVGWRATTGRSATEAAVIYNGVDLSDLPDGPGEPGEPPLLCYAGRFEVQKGIDVLLESIELAAGSGPPFRVAIHGAGTFEARVNEVAVQSHGRVTAGPPITDLRARIGSFDAILMPSRFEGLPLLALEALCVGVPVLATSAPGLDEVFPDGYPGRCRTGDSPAFAAVIRGFLADPAGWREEALRARPGARDRFSLETMTASYERLYARAIAS